VWKLVPGLSVLQSVLGFVGAEVVAGIFDVEIGARVVGLSLLNLVLWGCWC
jgi:hypothetical protein